MPTLPRFSSKTNRVDSPHVVILGAGASIAACPNGDKNGRELPSLQNVQSATGLDDLFDRIESKEGSLGEGFEEKYSRLVELDGYDGEVAKIEAAVHEYFSDIEIPDEVTVYDLMLLGLRKKDAIFTFNWDPLLLQAFARCGGIKEVPNLFFLHGCVGAAFCKSCKVKSNSNIPCPQCGGEMEATKLLYPVTEKDYESDPVIKNEWDALRDYLTNAYFVTLFGYSAPVTDVAARATMIEAFSRSVTRELSEVEVIDIRPRDDLETTWKDFFFSHHYGIFQSFDNSQINRHFRRSCDAFAMASLQCNPVPEHSPSGITDPAELRAFALDLIVEENNGDRFWDKHKNTFGTE